LSINPRGKEMQNVLQVLMLSINQPPKWQGEADSQEVREAEYHNINLPRDEESRVFFYYAIN
jgi:hypothetical protein